VIIHRAVSGSIERFIAILIEHFAGNFPTWLAPEQVRVVSIAPDWDGYAAEVAAALAGAGVRVGYDPEHLKDYREVIKEASHLKVPYMAVIGRREAEQRTVTLRRRGAEKQQASLTLDALVTALAEEIRTRALTPAVGAAGAGGDGAAG
jgi:threonyl-tRNA synthetase